MRVKAEIPGFSGVGPEPVIGAARRAEALRQPRNEERPNQKSATGWLPSRPNFCKLAGPGAESAPVPGLNKPSGRSQRGDSAWC